MEENKELNENTLEENETVEVETVEVEEVTAVTKEETKEETK